MDSNKLGKFLNRSRTKKELTLKKLGETIGFSDAYISMVEKGKRKKPSYEFLLKISDVLEVDYFDLMVLAGYFEENEARQRKKILDSISEKKTEKNINKIHSQLEKDLYYLLTKYEKDIYYKAIPLTINDKRKIKIMLQTILE